MKEQGKLDMYKDLRIKFRKPWKFKTEVVPMVIGALGTISHKLKFYLKKIPIVTSCLQKKAILGTAIILRGVLDISEFS